MAIPDYQTVMLPLLNLAADGEEHRLRDAVEVLADHFDLREDERKELLPRGSQATFDNRVGWARTYMKKAGIRESPRRGYFQITDQGPQALEQKPEMINVKFLEQYPEFLECKTKSNTKSATAEIDTAVPTEERTPRKVDKSRSSVRASRCCGAGNHIARWVRKRFAVQGWVRDKERKGCGRELQH
jgi:restriction system protein